MKDSDYYELQAGGSAWTHLAPQYKKRVCEAIDSLGDVELLDVIDVGCGDGESVKYLLEKGAHAVGLEYSKDKVEYAENHGLPVCEFDIDNPDWKGFFQYLVDSQEQGTLLQKLPRALVKSSAQIVFCSHTLEHTRDAVQSAKNLCSMVAGGGKLLIIVPHEEEFPTENPSHTQWMSNERIQKVKEVLEEYFTTVKEERKHRIEDEVWLTGEGRK